MYSFEGLVEEVLKNRPELDRSTLMAKIEEKKSNVGAGYLTSQGALFLIAGELGVRLDHLTNSDLTLKDLFIGANDITIVARVLAIYPSNEYRRKNGEKGRYRRLLLFDSDNTVKMTLWDEQVENIERLAIAVDTAVRVVNGYVKQGIDGRPSLNLGRRGVIELISDANIAAQLPRLELLSKEIGSLSDGQQVTSLRGVIVSEPKRSNFTRPDGSSGSLTQFRIADNVGENGRRVVIWNASTLPEFRPRQSVRITNLRVKAQLNGEMEIHGDTATTVFLSSSPAQMKSFRIGTISFEGQTTRVIVVDREKKLQEIELRENARDRVALSKPGDAIGILPDEEVKGVLICKGEKSIVEVPATPEQLPTLEMLMVKMKALNESPWPIISEVIALSKGNVQDVNLKDGSIVKKGELVVGDETGEVKLIGWREQANKVSGIEPGERIRMVGVFPQVSKMGALTLQMSRFVKIEKLRGE